MTGSAIRPAPFARRVILLTLDLIGGSVDVDVEGRAHGR
jgi:hypothetical protein